MTKNGRITICLAACLLCSTGTVAQEDTSRLRVDVVLVQLNVAVTDSKGHYITGLRPEDFEVTEDKIAQKISTFESGSGPQRVVTRSVPSDGVQAAETQAGDALSSPPQTDIAQTSVIILFDTSNYMYRGFVYAQDAIADFVRSLEGFSKVALYSYNRDLSRMSSLTDDRSQVLHGVRSTVAGDDAALYDCLLMTVKDAAHLTGRKAIVVFSNGPDNASVVPPEDVTELAQSTGTTIYLVSTRQAEADPISGVVFERMSRDTGGKAYFSKTWKDEAKAFAAIREDLEHLYSISYYPQPNPNRGWRSISIKLNGPGLQKYRIRTRDGYRPLQTEKSTELMAKP
jgi:VWFA-related protein